MAYPSEGPHPGDGLGSHPISAEADPGYFPSLTRRTTTLASLRTFALALTGSLPLLAAAVFLSVEPAFTVAPASLALPAFGLATVAATLAVPPVPALAPALSPHVAARTAVTWLRIVVLTRLTLCETAALLGVVASFLQPRGPLPFLLGALISAAGMAAVGLPTRAMIERVRVRLESEGTPSFLWNELLREVKRA
ncbi:hypothetical protein [Salinactinospora qingdaonensis]|uniref:Uncharacterized protein n=1 Tax=Salinactinospora qingdaonensis TaxID=702744 RepID=A0ABP7F0I9_9ACTN